MQRNRLINSRSLWYNSEVVGSWLLCAVGCFCLSVCLCVHTSSPWLWPGLCAAPTQILLTQLSPRFLWKLWSSESLWLEHLGCAEKKGHGNLRQVKCLLLALLFLFWFLYSLSKALVPYISRWSLKSLFSNSTKGDCSHHFLHARILRSGGKGTERKERKEME